MKFIPAIDLKDNKCVRLIQGREEDVTVFNDNPIQQAKFFEANGCERIHIVDLDGAFGKYDVNKNVIIEIRKNIKIPIELGGGLKNQDDISFWINQGIDFVILGSLAVENTELVLKMSDFFKKKIYVSLDILNEKVMIKGWLKDSDILINDIFNVYNPSSIKGFILTDVSRDGTMKGLDTALIKKLIFQTKKNIIVGGGLSDYSDLKAIKGFQKEHPNLEGVIAGKSFYSGNIKIDKALNLLKTHAEN